MKGALSGTVLGGYSHHLEIEIGLGQSRTCRGKGGRGHQKHHKESPEPGVKVMPMLPQPGSASGVLGNIGHTACPLWSAETS